MGALIVLLLIMLSQCDYTPRTTFDKGNIEQIIYDGFNSNANVIANTEFGNFVGKYNTLQLNPSAYKHSTVIIEYYRNPNGDRVIRNIEPITPKTPPADVITELPNSSVIAAKLKRVLFSDGWHAVVSTAAGQLTFRLSDELGHSAKSIMMYDDAMLYIHDGLIYAITKHRGQQ